MTTDPLAVEGDPTTEGGALPLAHGCTCGECGPACPSRGFFPCCGACMEPGAFAPAAPATDTPVDHYPRSDVTIRGTAALCHWCGEVFAGETVTDSLLLHAEHEKAMVAARRAREAAAHDAQAEER